MLEAPEDCYVLEAQEVTRLVRKLGKTKSVEIEPRAPTVGHEESVALSRLLSLWRAKVGAR